MEEAFVKHLRGIVVHKFGAYLLQIVARFDKFVGMRNGDALHIVHDHHMLSAQFRVGLRAVHVFVAFAESFEFRQIAGFD